MGEKSELLQETLRVITLDSVNECFLAWMELLEMLEGKSGQGRNGEVREGNPKDETFKPADRNTIT